MTINGASCATLEKYRSVIAHQKGIREYIGDDEAANIPNSPIPLLRSSTQRRAQLLLNSIAGLLHTTIYSQITGTKIIIYQNGKWDPKFIRGLEFRAGTEFLENAYLGEGGILSELLDFAKQQDVAIGTSAQLRYTQDGALYLERTEDTQPKPPAREPRIRATSHKPRMAYTPNANKTI